MKTRIIVAVTFLLLLSPPLTKPVAAFEDGYNRPGGEFIGKRSGVANAQQCYQMCLRNPNCVAFTWVKPNIQGPTGMCWLKGSLSKKVRNNCCVSGVVRSVKQDCCKWYQKGTTYTCYCQDSRTKKWYPTNPSACPKQKPPPRYIDHRKNCPPGQVWVDGGGTFGQGSGGYCRQK
jgi:hypothetical protein